eukprot:COSAG04_NODE_1245_length_7583_cov_3.055318_5_plen_183_part_00
MRQRPTPIGVARCCTTVCIEGAAGLDEVHKETVLLVVGSLSGALAAHQLPPLHEASARHIPQVSRVPAADPLLDRLQCVRLEGVPKRPPPRAAGAVDLGPVHREAVLCTAACGQNFLRASEERSPAGCAYVDDHIAAVGGERHGVASLLRAQLRDGLREADHPRAVPPQALAVAAAQVPQAA